MKHMKTYENSPNRNFKNYKYVVFHSDPFEGFPKKLFNYIVNNVGTVSSFIKGGNQAVITYQNVDDDILKIAKDCNRYGVKSDGEKIIISRVNDEEIKYMSNSKEDCEIYIEKEKFNL